MSIRFTIAAGALGLLALAAPPALAQERVTIKSAKAGSSYYQMAVQLSEALKGTADVTVEESQGSVQNVMEARARGADYVFTAPPGLVAAAQNASGPFEDKGDPAFDGIRALFPIPSLTMHFVVDADSGIEGFADMAGKTILLGSGSFGATEGERYLELFGVADRVTVADAELSGAVPALQNGQIDGFVTAGSYPAPNVIEAAASTDVRLLSMTEEEVAETGRTRLVIPAGTYPGQDADVVTTSLPVVAYATAAMPDGTAYALTRAFWENKDGLGGADAWWDGVEPAMIGNVLTEVHPGAARFYEEIGVSLPQG
jgi:TRAP transporter TAXI family solute receptor